MLQGNTCCETHIGADLQAFTIASLSSSVAQPDARHADSSVPLRALTSDKAIEVLKRPLSTLDKRWLGRQRPSTSDFERKSKPTQHRSEGSERM